MHAIPFDQAAGNTVYYSLDQEKWKEKTLELQTGVVNIWVWSSGQERRGINEKVSKVTAIKMKLMRRGG